MESPSLDIKRPEPKSVSPSALRARLQSFIEIAFEIQDGLSGKPFRWGAGEQRAYVPKAAALGVTLVTRSGAKKRGYRLKDRVKPVGSAYFHAPLSKWADLFVLECQCVKVSQKETDGNHL